MPKVNMKLDEDNDIIIDTINQNNADMIKDDVKTINNIFTFYKTDYYKNNNYHKVVVYDDMLESMLSETSKNVYRSYDSKNDMVDVEKLKKLYKEDFKYYYSTMLKDLIELYHIYNYDTQNKDNLIDFTPDELRRFTSSFVSLFNNIYKSYVDIDLPEFGGMDKKEFTLFFENIFKFNVYEKKKEVKLDNLDSKAKFNEAKKAYLEASNRLNNKPKLLDNKERDVNKSFVNDKVHENYLIKLRESYKQIEKIHASRPWTDTFTHMYSYIKEKRYMNKIVNKVEKMYKNTLYMDRVEDIIKGDDNNYQVQSLHLDTREKNTRNLLSASQTLFGHLNLDDKFGIDINNRDYLEEYKPRVKVEKTNINVEEVHDDKEADDEHNVYYRDLTSKKEEAKYKEL
jgi:hypothetical protein